MCVKAKERKFNVIIGSNVEIVEADDADDDDIKRERKKESTYTHL